MKDPWRLSGIASDAKPRAPWLVGVTLLGIAFWALVRAHLLYIDPAQWLNVDEGYAAALAIRLLENNNLPYVDGISIRGPLMYWIYELALGMGGPYSIAAVRFGAMVSSIATLCAVWSVPLALRSPLAGGIAALATAWSLTVAWPPPDGLAWNGEIIGLPFALAGVSAAVLALRGDSSSRTTSALLCASGALAACAFFVKQSLGPHALWSAVWILVMGRASMVVRARRITAFIVGAAAVGALVLLPYVVSGHLGDLWYYLVRYGRDVYMAPVTWDDVQRVLVRGILQRTPANLLLVTAIILPAAGAVWSLRRRRDRRVPDGANVVYFLIGHLLVAIPCATFTGRYFGHYFLQVDVFVWILLALSVFGTSTFSPRGANGPPRIGTLRLALATVILIASVPVLFTGQNRAWTKLTGAQWFQSMQPSRDPISAWVRENTDADDSIFVWGMRADIYLNAQRRPASRFVYCLFPSGVVPWYEEPFEIQQGRVVPGSQQALITDLEASQAEIVIDAGYSLLGRFMFQYPVLLAYLQENYCSEVLLFQDKRPADQVPVYRRKTPNRPCSPIHIQ